MEVETDGEGSGSDFGKPVRAVVLVAPPAGPERPGCDGFFSRTGARTAFPATGGGADSAVRAPNVLADGSRPERAGPTVDCDGAVFSERFVVDTTGAGATADDNRAGAAFEPCTADGDGSSFGRLGRVTGPGGARKRAVLDTTGACTNGGGNQAGAEVEPDMEGGTIFGRGDVISNRLAKVVMLVLAAARRGRTGCDDPFP